MRERERERETHLSVPGSVKVERSSSSFGVRGRQHRLGRGSQNLWNLGRHFQVHKFGLKRVNNVPPPTIFAHAHNGSAMPSVVKALETFDQSNPYIESICLHPYNGNTKVHVYICTVVRTLGLYFCSNCCTMSCT